MAVVEASTSSQESKSNGQETVRWLTERVAQIIQDNPKAMYEEIHEKVRKGLSVEYRTFFVDISFAEALLEVVIDLERKIEGDKRALMETAQKAYKKFYMQEIKEKKGDFSHTRLARSLSVLQSFLGKIGQSLPILETASGDTAPGEKSNELYSQIPWNDTDDAGIPRLLVTKTYLEAQVNKVPQLRARIAGLKSSNEYRLYCADDLVQLTREKLIAEIREIEEEAEHLGVFPDLLVKVAL